MLSRLIIRKLECVKPEQRRLWAAHIMVMSLFGWIVSHVLLVVFDQSTVFSHILMFISWWAIILTAADLVSTQDVRVQE